MVSSEADHIAPTQDSRVFVLTDEQARDEIEAKFLIEDTASVAQVIDALRAHNVQSVFAVDVVDRYWDTLDWCLLKEGWTYRWREASGRKSLTLKSVEPIRDVVHRRREVEQRVAAFPESDYPIPFRAGRRAASAYSAGRTGGAVSGSQLPPAVQHSDSTWSAGRDRDRPGHHHGHGFGQRDRTGAHAVCRVGDGAQRRSGGIVAATRRRHASRVQASAFAAEQVRSGAPDRRFVRAVRDSKTKAQRLTADEGIA